MKVLWLVSITIPAAADACGLQAKEIGGGWLSGALGGMTAAPDAPAITVASVDARAETLTVCSKNGVSFALVPTGSVENFSALLKKIAPDLVHIWGTEYPEAAAMQDAAADVFWPQARTAAVKDAAIRKACLPYIEQLRPLYPHGTEVRTRRDWRLFRWMMQTFGPRFTLWAASLQRK